ncbi:hypothetical protein F5Y05DRAFT_376318 [Hypoxylon sp. FL0543]|nr:hypothetical protein F5Y05DRAFT_376318 [Hypoxylon sp. FL0543]
MTLSRLGCLVLRLFRVRCTKRSERGTRFSWVMSRSHIHSSETPPDSSEILFRISNQLFTDPLSSRICRLHSVTLTGMGIVRSAYLSNHTVIQGVEG